MSSPGPSSAARRGRPRLPEAKRLSVYFKIRVTTQEADALYLRAIHERRSLSSLVREMLFTVVQQPHQP